MPIFIAGMIVGMIVGMIALCIIVAIFDFDAKIEFITGKAALPTNNETTAKPTKPTKYGFWEDHTP